MNLYIFIFTLFDSGRFFVEKGLLYWNRVFFLYNKSRKVYNKKSNLNFGFKFLRRNGMKDINEVNLDLDIDNSNEKTDSNKKTVLNKKSKNKDKAVEEKPTVAQEVWSWIKTIAIVIFIAVFVNKFIIINATIPSGSMENTIMTDSRLIGFRLSYIFSKPSRGDIIIFKYPVDESQLYIKRVIGLPGEKITIKKGKIYINDSKTPLKENYLKEKWVYKNDNITFNVPKDSYLMLGDNRNGSSDAREWADLALQEGKAETKKQAKKYSYVHKDKIIGRAIIKYYKGVEVLLDK